MKPTVHRPRNAWGYCQLIRDPGNAGTRAAARLKVTFTRTVFSFLRREFFMTVSRLPGLAITAAIAAIIGCNSERTTEPLTNDLKKEVIALGFRTAGMEDHGDYLVVEGDIRLDKAALSRRAQPQPSASGGRYPSRPAFQYSTTALVSDANVAQIKLDLSGISGVSDWAQAVRNAIADYNAAGSEVHMSEGTPADITYSSIAQFGDPDVIAQASWPSGGKPGPTITLAQNWNDLSLAQKEFVMVHELGHTL